MQGVTKGVLYCNNGRLDQINNGVYDRNVPTGHLQMVFDPRAVDTRRTVFPALDCRSKATVPIQKQRTYNIQSTFNPGSSAPYSGYASKIDEESRLKDIFMPVQKYNAQTQYIPSSMSDMYVETQPLETRNISQNHPLLFKQETFNPFNPNKCNLGDNVLYNHTRQQVKNMR